MTTIHVTLGPHGHDPNNPYTDLLLDHPRIDWQPWSFQDACTADILHLMWPELVTTEGSRLYHASMTAKLGTALTYRTLTNRPTIWTVHNVEPHRSNKLTHPWLAWMTNHIDGLAVHHPNHEAQAKHRYPTLLGTPTTHTPHGHYAHAYPPGPGREAARAHFDLPKDANVAAYIGTARDYKGIHQLATIRPKTPNWHFIAGGQGVEAYLSPLTRTHTLNRFLTPHEIATILDAADICILPYLKAWTSGAALLALTHRTPILVPDHIDHFHQLKNRCPPAWVHHYTSRLSPQDLHDVETHLPPPGDPNELYPPLRWDEAQENLLNLYDTLVD